MISVLPLTRTTEMAPACDYRADRSTTPRGSPGTAKGARVAPVIHRNFEIAADHAFSLPVRDLKSERGSCTQRRLAGLGSCSSVVTVFVRHRTISTGERFGLVAVVV